MQGNEVAGLLAPRKPEVERLTIDKGDHSGVILERLLVEDPMTDEDVHLRWLIFEIKAGPVWGSEPGLGEK